MAAKKASPRRVTKVKKDSVAITHKQNGTIVDEIISTREYLDEMEDYVNEGDYKSVDRCCDNICACMEEIQDEIIGVENFTDFVKTVSDSGIIEEIMSADAPNEYGSVLDNLQCAIKAFTEAVS